MSSEAEEIATNIAIDFVISLTNGAFDAAQHRNSSELDVEDFHRVLHNVYGIDLPGKKKTSESQPTSEYLDMLSVVQALQEAQSDD